MEDELDIYLIDNDGKRFSSEEISSHIGLAYIIFGQNEELKKEFERSGNHNPLTFLIETKGYITVSRIGNHYRHIIYNSKLASKEQKRWIKYYKERDYCIDDIALEKDKKQR